MRVGSLLAALALLASPALAAVPTIEEKTASMQAFEGFFPFYWDAEEGAVFLEIPRLGEDFLYINWLSRGLGSNPVGLDRAQLGDTRIVHFRRVGPKVLLEQPNQRYRAIDAAPDEARAVAESFASSILWGGKIEAASGERLLVDITPFLMRDSHGVVQQLKSSGEGDFRLDADRSAVSLEQSRAFPENTELEVLLTFGSDRPGRRVRETTPTPEAVTLYARHSFVQLPPEGYRPRRFDPRAGVIPITFSNYAAPLDQPLETRWVRRHRIEKKNPGQELSEPVEPIVYYVDRGAPEPVRSALVEGARWWNQAFEAAGFRDGFRVEVLPEDADPLDVRYNIINWVHRSTRGWSYGGSVVDPRTGEILKGVVTLGSLRVRQDRLLFEGLAPVFGAAASCGQAGGPDAATLAALAPDASPVEVALARLRQLSAHEVGHTLGFAHNFAASSYGRASVMDYPAPYIKISPQEDLDFSEAYDAGMGAWDIQAVRYAYSDFPAESEEAELDAILEDGLLFVSDADARPLGAMHPDASLWDNGEDSVAALEHTLQVRQIGLASFGKQSIRPDEPLSNLELALVPLYLHHRYQVEATVKLVGGARFDYAVRGGASAEPVAVVPPERQRAGLAAVLKTLSAQELALPADVLAQIPPPAYGYNDRREAFPSRSGRRFDPLAAAYVAADITAAALLEADRAARLLDFHARDPEQLSLAEVIDRTLAATWLRPEESTPALQAVRREAENAVLDRLLALAGDANADPSARALASEKLAALADEATEVERGDSWQATEARRRIERFLAGQATPEMPRRLDPPPGSPIG